jgi:GNAT superfamily N-acetyltransferase
MIYQNLPAPQDLVIEKVVENETLRKWCQTNIVGFEWPESLNDVLFNFYFDLGSDENVPLVNYIGWLNDEPVATSTLFLGAGIAGIYNVVTLPDARRKGIGAAITLKPLLEARAMGYRVGILQASEMGASVYRKLGFQEYCKIGNYVMEK